MFFNLFCFQASMKRGKGIRLMDFIKPLAALPYGFFFFYTYENGFSFLVAIFAVLLFIVFPAILVILWE